MPFYEREEKILSALMEKEVLSVGELSQKLYVSVPTLRRDLVKLEQKGKIIRTHGGAKLLKNAADEKIPFFLRESERYQEKTVMAQKAVELVRPGNVVMLDGSTSALALVPLLAEIPKLVVITSSARASVLLGELGVKNISTGGRMISRSPSFIGEDAERTVRSYNADIVFFSCHGLSLDGKLTDNSHEENSLRHAMFAQAKKRVCLCDSSKIGTICLHNLCHVSEVDAVISETPLPKELVVQIGTLRK